MKYKLNCLQYTVCFKSAKSESENKEREREGKRELSSESFYVKKIETGGQSD